LQQRGEKGIPAITPPWENLNLVFVELDKTFQLKKKVWLAKIKPTKKA
jgi:hypothetical protein